MKVSQNTEHPEFKIVCKIFFQECSTVLTGSLGEGAGREGKLDNIPDAGHHAGSFSNFFSDETNEVVSFPSFSHLGNSAISVKGKGKSLTNIKMYIERKVFFQKVKFNYKTTM